MVKHHLKFISLLAGILLQKDLPSQIHGQAVNIKMLQVKIGTVVL
jgi:hypothetical protein